VPGIGRDLSETVGPVVTAPGEHLDGGVPEMDLNPVAIKLDLVNPSARHRGPCRLTLPIEWIVGHWSKIGFFD